MAQNLPPPPAVADVHANRLLDDAYAHQQGPVTAATLVARAASRKSRAEELYLSKPPSLTQEEFGQQILFYFNSVNLGVPVGWAQAIASINAQLDNLATQQANTAQAIAAIRLQQHNLNARQINSTAAFAEDQLGQIQNSAGAMDPIYPATLLDFYNLNDAEHQQLLLFYGRPVDPIETRGQRLKQFLGLRL